MRDRSLLALLIIAAAFILYVKPTQEKIELLQARTPALDAQITAQENIRRNSAEFGGRVKRIGEQIAGNSSRLYPAETSESLALTDLQDFVKTTATNCKMEITTSTWGEAVADAKSGITRIPMTFTLTGIPADVDQFLKKLLSGRQFIKIERATINRVQDQQLVLTLALVAFKRGMTP